MSALEKFVNSLGFMGIGMLSIIIVIGVLIAVVSLLNLFTSDKVKKSRKIIFTVAVCALLLGIALLNGINL